MVTSGAAPDPTQAATGPQTGANAKVKLGVFLGTSPSGVRRFGDWLGREPDYAVDFSTRSTWSDISNPNIGEQWFYRFGRVLRFSDEHRRFGTQPHHHRQLYR